MEIFNLHSNNKKKIKGLKVTSHKEYDKNGKKRTNRYVEFTVVGKNRQWKDFMPVEDFKKLNPEINI
ncbi:hypothetical protein KKE18_03305 [Patescibacteria group bacterium]|nr:hypothetical protein [Patescibacteria group bacterium]MBU0923169.1 hypothetical protein [Patescibacteria group bacterium]MBU1844694.1 hypothetical protein [Patescibacteria group bacterium]